MTSRKLIWLGACPDSCPARQRSEEYERVWARNRRIWPALAGWRGSGGGKVGVGRTPPLGELQHVVGEADEGPFVGDLVEPAHQELTEAAGLLDLPEHRLGQLLAQPIRGCVSASLDFLAHGGDARAAAFSVRCVLAATRRNIGVKGALLHRGEIGVRAIPGVGRDLF